MACARTYLLRRSHPQKRLLHGDEVRVVMVVDDVIEELPKSLNFRLICEPVNVEEKPEGCAVAVVVSAR